MSITRKQIQEAADQLASEIWEDREVPGELERVDEIRRLTVEQLNDDVYSIRGGTGSGRTAADRIGREYVAHHDWHKGDSGENINPFWPSRTPDQQALEAAIRPFLDSLNPEYKLILEWYFGGQLTERQIAALQNHDSQPTIHRKIKAALADLKGLLELAFYEKTTT